MPKVQIGPEAPTAPGPEAPTGSPESNATEAQATADRPPRELASPDRPAISGSPCEPFRQLILAKLDAELSAPGIHQNLTAENDSSLGDWSVNRFMGSRNENPKLPFRRFKVAPGEELQVDLRADAPGVFEVDPAG